MFKIEPTYSFCGKNIEAYEEVYVKNMLSKIARIYGIKSVYSK